MKYSQKLLETNLLEHARKAGSFYLICDVLAVRFPKAQLDVEGPQAMSVKVGRKLVGTITATEPLKACSVAWIFTDATDSSNNLNPGASSGSADYA
jgi:hypothetical protein